MQKEIEESFVLSYSNNEDKRDQFIQTFPVLYHAVRRDYISSFEKGQFILSSATSIRAKEDSYECTNYQEKKLGKWNNWKVIMETYIQHEFFLFCMSIDKSIKSIREHIDSLQEVGGSRVLYEINTERFIASIINAIHRSRGIGNLGKLHYFDSGKQKIKYTESHYSAYIVGGVVSYPESLGFRISPYAALYNKNKVNKDEKEVRLAIQLYEEIKDKNSKKFVKVRNLSSDAPIIVKIDATNCFRRIE